MFHNIKGKKHGLKFVIKGKKVFLCDTNLNYVNVKIYRTTALAMRCMIFGGDPVLGSPFYLAWPHRLRIKQATCVVHGFHNGPLAEWQLVWHAYRRSFHVAFQFGDERYDIHEHPPEENVPGNGSLSHGTVS